MNQSFQDLINELSRGINHTVDDDIRYRLTSLEGVMETLLEKLRDLHDPKEIDLHNPSR